MTSILIKNSIYLILFLPTIMTRVTHSAELVADMNLEFKKCKEKEFFTQCIANLWNLPLCMLEGDRFSQGMN